MDAKSNISASNYHINLSVCIIGSDLHRLILAVNLLRYDIQIRFNEAVVVLVETD